MENKKNDFEEISFHWKYITKMIRELRLKNTKKVIDIVATDTILSQDFILSVIEECLIDNDREGVFEVINIYFDTLDKVKNKK